MTTLLYDAAALIESVRNIARLPGDVGSAGSRDEDILRHLNEELLDRLLPAIVGVKEEYSVVTQRVPLVASKRRYRLLTRAAGGRLRNRPFYVDSNGVMRPLWPIDRGMLHRHNQTEDSTPTHYFLEGQHIVLVPPLGASVSGFLELSYYFRPSTIVLVAETAKITSINPGTGAVVLDSAPDAFANGDFDIHSADSGAEIRVWDKTATWNAGTSTLTFTPADINGSEYMRDAPEVGDYVCLAGECAVPPLPRELHSVLAQATAARFLRFDGHQEAADKAEEDYEKKLKNALDLIDDRIEEDPGVIVNPYSFLGPSRPRGGKDSF